MKIGKKSVKIFNIRNRAGYAALCDDHLTEGKTPQQAYDRMVKAINRTYKKALQSKSL
ncbi:MAG TPA: hypothetical protein PLT76_09975 [Candidatus Omnitrophota bacterium]|nr:hypothetical protein [Candidatus Omnitrophota bacterium]HPB68375.1 hypothetical protein [Candidatus Omnitrophota bacterium]HQO59028.1 hypothetical protein [Candidatus Omnitrophota bacterium]HQP12353.1 hypothetical protein [Candidatus Omnitrophota bacterium]